MALCCKPIVNNEQDEANTSCRCTYTVNTVWHRCCTGLAVQLPVPAAGISRLRYSPPTPTPTSPAQHLALYSACFTLCSLPAFSRRCQLMIYPTHSSATEQGKVFGSTRDSRPVQQRYVSAGGARSLDSADARPQKLISCSRHVQGFE